MITLIVTMSLFLIIGIVILLSFDPYERGEAFIPIIGGFLLISGMISLLLGVLFGNGIKKEYQKENVYQLKSITDDSVKTIGIVINNNTFVVNYIDNGLVKYKELKNVEIKFCDSLFNMEVYKEYIIKDIYYNLGIPPTLRTKYILNVPKNVVTKYIQKD